MTAWDVEKALATLASDVDTAPMQRFFKTGAGQYSEGDIFIGVRVPALRRVCREYQALPLAEVRVLLGSPIHEHRLAGLIILANRYAKAPHTEQEDIFRTYLQAVYDGRVNNWDLVDVTAEYVIGEHERHTDRGLLFDLAASENIWQKRVAILSAFRFVKAGDASTTLALAERLLHDPHDLIQKAVGWQLREVGKRVDRSLLLAFLDKHAATMPRTALRYAIEHLPADQKQYYMTRKHKEK